MLSAKIQMIIVFLILFAIMGWILWKLLSKKGHSFEGKCAGCTLAEKCTKKEDVASVRGVGEECEKK